MISSGHLDSAIYIMIMIVAVRLVSAKHGFEISLEW